MRRLLANRLLSDDQGTAALEFALVLPVMVALALGLAGSVRHSLAEIDADAAAGAGALAALRHGYAPGAIAAAAMAADPATTIDEIRLIVCDTRRRACAGLPPGHYASITTSRTSPSLLQPARYRTTAIVRLAESGDEKRRAQRQRK